MALSPGAPPLYSRRRRIGSRTGASSTGSRRLASLRPPAEDSPPDCRNDPGFMLAPPPSRPDSGRFRGFGGAFSRSPHRIAFRPVSTRVSGCGKVYIIGPIGSWGPNAPTPRGWAPTPPEALDEHARFTTALRAQQEHHSTERHPEMASRQPGHGALLGAGRIVHVGMTMLPCTVFVSLPWGRLRMGAKLEGTNRVGRKGTGSTDARPHSRASVPTAIHP